MKIICDCGTETIRKSKNVYECDFCKKEFYNTGEEIIIYDWKQNKGYPTRKHREALQKFGTTSHHRKSFQLLPKQLVLKL